MVLGWGMMFRFADKALSCPEQEDFHIRLALAHRGGYLADAILFLHPQPKSHGL